MSKATPKNYDELRENISERYNSLSKRLQDIAKFALEHPTDMALETIATISERANVPPSALIRFAQALHFSGFSEMQRTFQSRVVERSASYKERVRDIVSSDGKNIKSNSESLFSQFCDANILSLEELKENIDPEELLAATKLLDKANTIYLVAQRRSYPVASYLAYALSHADRNPRLLDGSGGMLYEQAGTMKATDALLTISFYPYAPETNKVVNIAEEKGVPIVAITDSTLNPIANIADVSLISPGAEVMSFRSLCSSICIAQTLATSLVLREQTPKKKL